MQGPPDVCQRLRYLVHDCLAKHLHTSAVFYADKLVTLSEGMLADVYTLAQAYFMSKQWRRCLLLLRTHHLLEADLRCRYLAALCLVELEDWDECIAVLGGVLDPDEEALAEAAQSGAATRAGEGVDLGSATCLLRARVFKALEHYGRATAWYKAALRTDPFCYEAFQELTDGNMLTAEEEHEVRESLRFREQDRWLQLLYRAKGRKSEQQKTMEAVLEELEAPRASPVGFGPGVAPQPESSGETQSRPRGMQGEDDENVVSSAPGNSNKLRNGRAHSVHEEQNGQNGAGGRRGDKGAPQGVRTRARAAALASGGPSNGPKGNNSQQEAMETRENEPEARPEQPMSPLSDAENAGKGGCGLAGNVDVAICRAEWFCHLGAYQECYALTASLLEKDPHAVGAMPVHITAAYELRKKNDLFLRGHKLVEECPESAVAWYAVGCYYLVCGQLENARRYFGKATAADGSFAPAWLAFGHAFAAQDESDQAMAAYRTATRRFPGLHLPLLGMAMEYMRMNNAPLAEQLLLSAHRSCPSDPLVCNELGALAYRLGRYSDAEQWLLRALQRMPTSLTTVWETVVVNLAHCYRKQGKLELALQNYQQALALNPGQPGTYAALGFTYHVMGSRHSAIEFYHKALGLRPDDTFTAEMLTTALTESGGGDDL